jgi:HD superfamily phosphohydrolase
MLFINCICIAGTVAAPRVGQRTESHTLKNCLTSKTLFFLSIYYHDIATIYHHFLWHALDNIFTVAMGKVVSYLNRFYWSHEVGRISKLVPTKKQSNVAVFKHQVGIFVFPK